MVSSGDYSEQSGDKYLSSFAVINMNEPASISNCIDTSLNFTIDALGGGAFRAPVQP